MPRKRRIKSARCDFDNDSKTRAKTGLAPLSVHLRGFQLYPQKNLYLHLRAQIGRA
jgi:hypothetical protein